MADPESSQPIRSEFLLTMMVVLFCLLALACMGGLAFIELPARIVFGWVFFVLRNLTQIHVSWIGLASFLLFWMGTILLGRVALRTMGANPEIRQWRVATIASIAILAMFVAGIGVTGIVHQAGWILRKPSALFDHHGRSYVWRMIDSNQFHQLAVAAYQSKLIDESVPVSTDSIVHWKSRSHGWQTQLLPYMSSDQVDVQAIFESIDLSKSWNDPVNSGPLSHPVFGFERMLHDEALLPRVRGGYGLSHQAANALLFGSDGIESLEDVKDGWSSTVFAGNAAGAFLPWGHPTNWRDARHLPNSHPEGMGSEFAGGCHVVMFDGNVRFVTESIDPQVWQHLFDPNESAEWE